MERLRTYPRVWNYEKKIYAIENVRLIVPINPGELLYFAAGLAVAAALGKVLPVFAAVPFLIRYVLLPYALMKFLTKKKLDGKLPHLFFIGYIAYLTLPKTISRFQAGENYKKGRFTSVVCRERKVIDATRELMGKGVRKRGV